MENLSIRVARARALVSGVGHDLCCGAPSPLEFLRGAAREAAPSLGDDDVALRAALATQYVVLDSAAAMPQNCWGIYRRVGLLLIDGRFSPGMIAAHARGALHVRTWERLNAGKTRHCAFAKAKATAEAMATAFVAGAPDLAWDTPFDGLAGKRLAAALESVG